MNFENLDCRQREVVDETLRADRKILALGGPGTGKTTTALWTARKYLEDSGRTPADRVLFLTFSRAAVGQIVSRSPGILSGYENRIEIMTFHALAFRILRAFGRYAGYGVSTLSLQTKTRAKLLGRDRSSLQYDDLIPGATRIIEGSSRISQIVRQRWGLVICDEVQDTGGSQLRLLSIIAGRKLLMLGDRNQMIYTFLAGVSPDRFERVQAWADREIELLTRSHRDPSGAIPALANAIRRRQFKDVSVADALNSDRLYIYRDISDEERPELIRSLVLDARRRGSCDIGIFAKTNLDVADLADQLNDLGVVHDLVGIPEAHAEALGSMATQCAFGAHLTSGDEVRKSLALFLTASVRQTSAPGLALGMVGRGRLPPAVDLALHRLEEALVLAAEGTIGGVAEVAMRSWDGLSITSGHRPWRRAAQHFWRLVGQLRYSEVTDDSIGQLLEVIDRARAEALVDIDYAERGTVKLMNYHQTKGREADTVVLVFGSDDFYGNEREPFEVASKLLNVAISRARQRVIVILPPDPHSLVEPFTDVR